MKKESVDVWLKVSGVYFREGQATVDFDFVNQTTRKDLRLEDAPRLVFPEGTVAPEEIFNTFHPGFEVLLSFRVASRDEEE